MNNKSFTLIELVVAIVIMVIIAAMGTIIQLKSYSSLKLDAAAQKIASDIRSAQELVMDRSPLAISDTIGRFDVTVEFSNGSNVYTIKNGLGLIITNPATGQPWQVNIGTEFKGVTIFDFDFALGGYSKIFFESPLARVRAFEWLGGELWSPAELNAAGGTITLRDTTGRTKIVRIAQSTGRVTIE